MTVAGRHAPPARRRATPARRRPRLLPITLVVVAGALIAAGGVVVVGGIPIAGASTDCSDGAPLRVAAAPEIAPVLDRATAALEKEAASHGTCVDYRVVSRAPDEVASSLGSPAKAPDLWVPDFSVWVDRVKQDGARPTLLAGSLAKSPVITAGPHPVSPTSWMEVGKTTVAYLDPLRSSASTVALLSAFGEMAMTGASQEQMGSMMVPLAQRYGAQPDKPTTIEQVATAAAHGAYGVMTEQQLVSLQHRGIGTDLTAQVPDTGTMALDYPLAALSPDQRTRDAGKRLAQYLAGPQGRRLLARNGFRDTSDDPLPNAAGLGARDFTVLRLPDARAVSDAMHKWAVLTVPARSIAVLDVSGSMDFTDGTGQSRISIAVGAATRALSLYPDNAQIGVWAFSQGLGGHGRDYRQLADIAPLGAVADGRTHREELAAALGKLPQITNGGTGLYDTTLAAVRALQSHYDPRAENTVILLTDGRNDDPNSPTLSQLVDTLRRERDPARPVSVIAVGMGPDADAHALGEIAAATGGHSYVARDPGDIGHVFLDAMLSR
ncbi:MAG: substrate-binding and VWA domain-containing protein [Actinomycetes bacterium]